MPELKYVLSHKIRNSSPGKDRIAPAMLKHLHQNAMQSLLQVYNLIWSTGKIPNKWKTAIIIPILKPNQDQFNVNSYRPIALINVMGKVLEKNHTL